MRVVCCSVSEESFWERFLSFLERFLLLYLRQQRFPEIPLSPTLTSTMLFSKVSGSGQQRIGNNKNSGKSLVILIAMRMRRCAVGCIARWSTSRASLGATGGSRHRVSACAVSPRRPPWSTNLLTTQNTTKTQLLASNYGTFWLLFVYENFIPQNGPSTQLIVATSFV